MQGKLPGTESTIVMIVTMSLVMTLMIIVVMMKMITMGLMTRKMTGFQRMADLANCSGSTVVTRGMLCANKFFHLSL